ncbi:MAG: hypothetical protein ACI835_005254, partial [Planctomycetota bacterium]
TRRDAMRDRRHARRLLERVFDGRVTFSEERRYTTDCFWRSAST